MDKRQMESYLERLGLSEVNAPNLAALKQLQEHHIYMVPVENLDIIEKRLPLSLEIDDLFEKVVNRRRGGLSFELNLLFADALTAMGFKVRLLSAKHPKYGHEFDHALILVELPEDGGSWIVDVGYIENFRTPLLFDSRIWQSDGRDAYTFRKDSQDAESWQLIRRRGDREELIYTFTLNERFPSDYQDQCDWFCRNEKSRFTRRPYVSIERPEGRICLSYDTVENIYTHKPIRPVIENQGEYESVLREIFGIESSAQDTLDGGLYEDGNTLRRIAGVLSDAVSDDEVIERAVERAKKANAHLRFVYAVDETDKADSSMSFQVFVQVTRDRMKASLSEKLASLNDGDSIQGGELVVMGLNKSIRSCAIDEAVGVTPQFVTEMLIKPFNPDLVICKQEKMGPLSRLLGQSASDYFSRKLTCDVEMVG